MLRSVISDEENRLLRQLRSQRKPLCIGVVSVRPSVPRVWVSSFSACAMPDADDVCVLALLADRMHLFKRSEARR